MTILESYDSGITTVALNDPARRNALSLVMFDDLDAAVARLAQDAATQALIIRGEGPAFCAGFDLGACVADGNLLPQYILRLSGLIRAIRRLPQVTIAQVHGAAIAGGCALLSACDFVIVAPDAKLGYPVHAIGISPAVTIPTLRLAIGDGAARALVMSGEIIDGIEAHRCGLATHVASTAEALETETAALAQSLTRKGQHALRTTKAWLNELDGSNVDKNFEPAANDSAEASTGEESKTMLARFWEQRRG